MNELDVAEVPHFLKNQKLDENNTELDQLDEDVLLAGIIIHHPEYEK